MTADPRATARQWLADTMCADLDIDLDKPSCRRCLEKADAILSAPGVGVGTERYRDPGDPAEVHTGVVIRLPVEVAGDG